MSKYKYDFTLNAAEKNSSLTGLASRVQKGQHILELGCSYGYLSHFLQDQLDCSVVGVDIDDEAIKQAAPFCTHVILCADVLEHLKNPIALLASLKPFLHKDSRLLASVPNIAHASIRLELLQGHFDYESLGLLDDTHLHFYTRDGLIKMLMQAGYVCTDIAYSSRDLADEVIEQGFAAMGVKPTEKTQSLLRAPDAMAYQFIIEARPAKEELVKHIPHLLSPKPLASTGVFYSELRETIVNLQKQNASLETQNKNHLANIRRLEESVFLLEQQRNAERVHNSNYKKEIARFEERILNTQQLRDAERVHNSNYKKEIARLEEKIVHTQQQRDAERVHNSNYKKEIKQWCVTVATVDDALFDVSEENISIREQNKNLLEQIAHITEQYHIARTGREHLEQVLQRVHKKISYRIVRAAKDFPKTAKKLLVSTGKQALDKSRNADIVIARENNLQDYTQWLAQYGELTQTDKQDIKLTIENWQDTPKIAVLMPVYNPQSTCLENAINSVLNQLYPNFQLCIADDASTKPYVRELLQKFEQQDQRIKVVYRTQNGHISAASNSALELVNADYVALMDHDDLLTPDALYQIAKTLQQYPEAELIYSDEDKMNLQGERYAPYFKPDWNLMVRKIMI